MILSLRLAALLGLLAFPALAQTPAAPSPSAAPAPAAAPRAGVVKRVDINGATERQLDSLPGIGPARSRAIVAGRPYAEMTDLVGKKVLTQPVFDGVKDRLALANVNASSAADMVLTLKGIGEARSRAIVAGRPYATPQDLVTKGVLTQAALDGIKDQITY